MDNAPKEPVKNCLSHTGQVEFGKKYSFTLSKLRVVRQIRLASFATDVFQGFPNLFGKRAYVSWFIKNLISSHLTGSDVNEKPPGDGITWGLG